MESKLKCPYCGWLYSQSQAKKRYRNFDVNAVPTHDFPPMCRAVCRGSGQSPRLDIDDRPLGKDANT